jgi:hypothetical protein
MKKPLIFLSLIFICISSIILSSCATNSYQPPRARIIETKFTINKNYDNTWQGLVNWFASHNSPIKNIDKSSGLITTEYNLSVQDQARYLDCGVLESGTLQSARFGESFGNFNILVAKIDDNSTKVTINCFFKTIINQYNLKGELIFTEKVDCNSTGVLEKEIIRSIE